MPKILQAMLQQYVNQELQMYKLSLEKAEEPEIKLLTPSESQKKARVLKKKIYQEFFSCSQPLALPLFLAQPGSFLVAYDGAFCYFNLHLMGKKLLKIT